MLHNHVPFLVRWAKVINVQTDKAVLHTQYVKVEQMQTSHYHLLLLHPWTPFTAGKALTTRLHHVNILAPVAYLKTVLVILCVLQVHHAKQVDPFSVGRPGMKQRLLAPCRAVVG
jgi:hypothetical protein